MADVKLVKAIALSGNAKIGQAATTYAPQATCPSDCPFFGAGCYAERGFVGIQLRQLNNAAAESSATTLELAQAEADAIDAMPTVVGRPLRIHTVGDCASDEAARIVSGAAERYTARGGGPAWSYTHAWRTVDRESWGGMSVLASCETTAEVIEATERGYATALVVDRFRDRKKHEVGDIEILPCPAQTKKGTTCSSCRLCFDDEAIKRRRYSIGFEVHGDFVTKRAAHATLVSQDPGRR